MHQVITRAYRGDYTTTVVKRGPCGGFGTAKISPTTNRYQIAIAHDGFMDQIVAAAEILADQRHISFTITHDALDNPHVSMGWRSVMKKARHGVPIPHDFTLVTSVPPHITARDMVKYLGGAAILYKQYDNRWPINLEKLAVYKGETGANVRIFTLDSIVAKEAAKYGIWASCEEL